MSLGLDEIREQASALPWRPTVFFEEWYDPLISGIRWTEELVQIAGGDPIFPELDKASLAKDRIAARPGWAEVPAVKNGQIYEVKSTYILQPGPAALTDGVRQLHDVIRQSVNR